MLLYHASTLTLESPRIVNRFKTLDFGESFYTTTNEDQACEFALKVRKRRKLQGKPTVNVYSFNEARAFQDLIVATIPSLMEKIGADSIEEIEAFYRSQFYQVLSDRSTSLWHLSAATLAQLYDDERERGCIDMPEEQS